jgi:hypothetical protein
MNLFNLLSRVEEAPQPDQSYLFEKLIDSLDSRLSHMPSKNLKIKELSDLELVLGIVDSRIPSVGQMAKVSPWGIPGKIDPTYANVLYEVNGFLNCIDSPLGRVWDLERKYSVRKDPLPVIKMTIPKLMALSNADEDFI